MKQKAPLFASLPKKIECIVYPGALRNLVSPQKFVFLTTFLLLFQYFCPLFGLELYDFVVEFHWEYLFVVVHTITRHIYCYSG